MMSKKTTKNRMHRIKCQGFTHEAFDRAVREDRVVPEHSLGPLLLDSTDCGGFLPQHLVQVFHDLQLLPSLVLLPGEVPSALRGALDRRGLRGGRGARSLGSVLALVPPALDGHPLRFAEEGQL